MSLDSTLSISLSGVKVKHALTAGAVAAGFAGASALSRYSPKLAEGLPAAFASMRTHETALCIFLSTLAFLPLVENRTFSKARLQEFYQSYIYNETVAGWAKRITPNSIGKSMETGYLFAAQERFKQIPDSCKRVIEASSYLLVASTLGSIGLAVLRSTSWMSELKTHGIALSMALMAIKGLYHYSSDLSGNLLGGGSGDSVA